MLHMYYNVLYIYYLYFIYIYMYVCMPAFVGLDLTYVSVVNL